MPTSRQMADDAHFLITTTRKHPKGTMKTAYLVENGVRQTVGTVYSNGQVDLDRFVWLVQSAAAFHSSIQKTIRVEEVEL